MKAVIYARYSSDSQREESIEGQLRECTAFAEKNGITVLRHYIDRAYSAKTDNRPEFQNMIKDSGKRLFDIVIVWKLDRFARNRYDSARYKAALKKNGVKVVSATEVISDGAEGIILESVLEGYAEYYSADLSEKVVRGMTENALKSKYNGGTCPIGYLIDSDQCFQLDPLTAPFVREAFQRYDEGATMTQIRDWLNEQGVKNTRGQKMTYNSVQHLLNNRRYIGEYTYRDIVVPDGIPAIVPQALFDRVQEKLAKNKKAPARHKAEDDYLLTTKLFCGYCREMMTGYSGTGKSGKVYHYYACNNFKRRKCKKKVVSKEKIEDRVVLECRKLLTDSNIERIAASVSEACEADRDTVAIKRIKTAIREADTAIENLWKALEAEQAADMITQRIEKRQKDKEELQAQLAIEMGKQVMLSAPDVRAYLYALKHGDKNDENVKRGIINVFLRAVYLYDGTFNLILNGSDKPISIDNILLDEIEEGLDEDLSNHTLSHRWLRTLHQCKIIRTLDQSVKGSDFLFLSRILKLSFGIE